jgi:hypothetical protein
LRKLLGRQTEEKGHRRLQKTRHVVWTYRYVHALPLKREQQRAEQLPREAEHRELSRDDENTLLGEKGVQHRDKGVNPEALKERRKREVEGRKLVGARGSEDHVGLPDRVLRGARVFGLRSRRLPLKRRPQEHAPSAGNRPGYVEDHP